MIKRFHQTPIPFILALLALAALACQAVTPIPAEPEEFEGVDTAVVVNEADIIAKAVATISAQTVPVNSEPVVIESSAPISNDLQDQLINIYDRINPSVVHIFIFDSEGFPLGSGSGFVIDIDGHIVTNNHVVADGEVIEVVFANGERRRGSITGTDIDSDLAVIQVDSLPLGANPVPLGDSSNVRVGEFVIAIGNPFGESGSMTVGIVSGLGRTLDSQRTVLGGRFSIPQVIQTDAAINPGNSGGPLLNLQGEVVGINSAIFSLTGSNSGVGFAIPVDAVTSITPSLIEKGSHDYSFIGITMTSDPFTLAELERLEIPPNGVYVTTVQEGSPGDLAGLIGSNTNEPNSNTVLPGGDYIRAVDGIELKSSNDLLTYLVFETQPGDTVNLTVLRNGEEILLPLTLGERP